MTHRAGLIAIAYRKSAIWRKVGSKATALVTSLGELAENPPS